MPSRNFFIAVAIIPGLVLIRGQLGYGMGLI